MRDYYIYNIPDEILYKPFQAESADDASMILEAICDIYDDLIDDYLLLTKVEV